MGDIFINIQPGYYRWMKKKGEKEEDASATKTSPCDLESQLIDMHMKLV
jgi:hypothetical protein